MPIGVIINVCSVILGGLLGSLISEKLSDGFKQHMTTIFGICAMSMGVASIILMQNMPAVIFAIIAGTILGLALDLDGRIRRGTGRLMQRFAAGGSFDEDLLVTAIVLFCASGTGIYGSLTAGMTGDHSILIAKSILDFFTAMIFACQLKKAVCLIGIPQLVILLALFFAAKLILPLTDAVMINDFKAVGGIVLLATGFSIMRVKQIPVADMIPAMILAMPVSALWTHWIFPLIG